MTIPETVVTSVSYSVASSSLSSLQISPSSKVKKSANGFGLTSLLPSFSKKSDQSKNKLSDDKNLAESLTSSYICQAAGYFTVAQHHESNADLEPALAAYKEGIQILLSGGKGKLLDV